MHRFIFSKINKVFLFKYIGLYSLPKPPSLPPSLSNLDDLLSLINVLKIETAVEPRGVRSGLFGQIVKMD